MTETRTTINFDEGSHITIDLDTETGVCTAYLTVDPGARVAHTIMVTDWLNIDTADDDHIVGIETTHADPRQGFALFDLLKVLREVRAS